MSAATTRRAFPLIPAKRRCPPAITQNQGILAKSATPTGVDNCLQDRESRPKGRANSFKLYYKKYKKPSLSTLELA